MKQLELELKKRLLIVEAPEGELTAIGNGDEVYYAIKKDETYIKIVDGKKWKLICKGSELTEEVAKDLVKGMYNDTYLKNTNISQMYQCGTASYVSSAKYALIRQIETKGFYLKNKPKPDDYEYKIYMTTDLYDKDLEKWQEVESRTFNPEKTLIFEIL